MKLELKNVVIIKAMSEETTCFSATLFIDGQEVGDVGNDGHGGSNRYFPHTIESTLDEYGKTLPLKPSPFSDGDPYQQDAESLINDLLDRREVEKGLVRRMKTNLTFTDPKKKGIFQVKMTPELIQKYLNLPPEELAPKRIAVILNGLPIAEAVDLYLANTL